MPRLAPPKWPRRLKGPRDAGIRTTTQSDMASSKLQSELAQSMPIGTGPALRARPLRFG